VKKEFIVNRQGKDFVLYAGLLDQAHREGLKRITTTLLQAPTSENGHLAICHAEVETEKGTFTGIGDACPENVGRMIAMHSVRMAETRAKARALRDAINVGVTAFEELGEVEEDPSDTGAGLARYQGPRAITAVPRSAPRDGEPESESAGQSIPGLRLQDGAHAVATPQQLDKLHKLQAALGRPAIVSSNLSTEEATRQIAELVRIFNAQSRGTARTGSR